ALSPQDVSPLRALLTQSSLRASGLRAWGSEVAGGEESLQGPEGSAATFLLVCDRTRAALFRERNSAPGALLGGPVYSECAAALASLRVGGDVVSVLSDCTALTDALVQRSSGGARGAGLCKDLVADLQPPAPVPEASAPSGGVPAGAAQAMEEVCVETLQIVETGVSCLSFQDCMGGRSVAAGGRCRGRSVAAPRPPVAARARPAPRISRRAACAAPRAPRRLQQGARTAQLERFRR
ncbi:unnamed protein product, partial [Prorocentrum cordatum]